MGEKMSFNKDVKTGLAIAAAGLFILLGQLGVFGYLFKALWPVLLLLLPGVLAHALFFAGRMPALILVPGAMLTVYGLLFAVCNVFGWHLMRSLWPVLLLGIAVGLYEYAYFGGSRNRVLPVAAWTLAGLSVLLLFFGVLKTAAFYVLGLLLIAVGIWLALSRDGRRQRRSRW